jgi:hypothetical protein
MGKLPKLDHWGKNQNCERIQGGPAAGFIDEPVEPRLQPKVP